MKIWLKYLIGCALGIFMALLMQGTNESAAVVINYLCDFSIRAGRYALLPLLFFTMTVAVFELRVNKSLFKTAVLTICFSVISTAILTIIGALSVIIAKPPRLPIAIEEVAQLYTLDVFSNILKLVPLSNFDSFLDGKFLLPLLVFAGFAGAGAAADRSGSKPMLTLFDSVARVSYAVICFFIDMMAVGLVAVSCVWFFSFKEVIGNPSFRFLILLVSIDVVLVVLILYPLVMRLCLHEKHPYRVIFASVASVITAFFSGDYNLTLGVSLRHARESLGIDTKISSVCMPVFSVFARGGAALIMSASFLVILKSYSDLGIWQDIPWILGTAFVISFLLGSMPTQSAFIGLAVMCTLYGSGFENGYLIIKAAAFFLCSAAAVIDAVTSIVGSYFIASQQNMVQHKEVKNYI